MRAMTLNALGALIDNPAPLRLAQLADPVPADGELLIEVHACGICHTELDEIEGRMPPPRLPIVLGHQVVGRVAEPGAGTSAFKLGDRVGVAWIFSACGNCDFCRRGEENLCEQFRATGRDANGGYAELMTVPEAFAHRIPDAFTDAEAAPLLCAGAIGYRSLRLAGLRDGQNLGLTGFGASGHLVLKMARHRFPNSRTFVFARAEAERAFALELGAVWAGDTTAEAPEKIHSIIDTTPAWTPIVEALRNLEPGGRLVINAIRKEDRDQDALLRLDYPAHLWKEKEIKTVANVTRADVREFLQLAAEIPIKPEVQEFPLEEANAALVALKSSSTRGAKVLSVR
jgi:alcohol dehydrogenase, propanol-preferring